MLKAARVTVVAFALILSASILHAQNSKAVETAAVRPEIPMSRDSLPVAPVSTA